MTSPDRSATFERRRQQRADEEAAYRAALERSQLNRDRWSADERAQVETAEQRMRHAVAERRRRELEER